jgi:hypothetical protein
MPPVITFAYTPHPKEKVAAIKEHLFFMLLYAVHFVLQQALHAARQMIFYFVEIVED